MTFGCVRSGDLDVSTSPNASMMRADGLQSQATIPQTSTETTDISQLVARLLSITKSGWCGLLFQASSISSPAVQISMLLVTQARL